MDLQQYPKEIHPYLEAYQLWICNLRATKDVKHLPSFDETDTRIKEIRSLVVRGEYTRAVEQVALACAKKFSNKDALLEIFHLSSVFLVDRAPSSLDDLTSDKLEELSKLPWRADAKELSELVGEMLLIPNLHKRHEIVGTEVLNYLSAYLVVVACRYANYLSLPLHKELPFDAVSAVLILAKNSKGELEGSCQE